jgi:IS30 family transposase
MGSQQLADWEQYRIAWGRSRGERIKQMVKGLGRSPSTISREVKRSADKSDGRCRAEKAISYAKARRSRCHKGTQCEAEQLLQAHRLVQRKWSPEQFGSRLRKQGRLSIGRATIYRWHARDKTQEEQSWLRTRQLSRRYRKGCTVKDRRRRMSGKKPLTERERPEPANDSSEVGHIEGDAVIGKDGRHCLLTLDNGAEFHGFKPFEEKLGIEMYFAQPCHSWERGTNENTNGLIRQYLPRGTCLKELTQKRCNEIGRELNDRPRKILGFDTPNEAQAEARCV